MLGRVTLNPLKHIDPVGTVLVPFATLFLLDTLVLVKNPVYFVVWSAHMMMVIVCAFASMFNRPIGYFIITQHYCRDEMARVYGAAMVRDSAVMGDK